jgi:hypothetical protein
VGLTHIFKNFPAERFSIYEKGSLEEVMISLEVTEESLLSDGTYKLSIRTAIGQAPFHKSIFHFLREFISFVSSFPP